MDKSKVFQQWYPKVHFSNTPDGCWEWTGSKDKNDYGKICIESKLYYAAVISWWIYMGKMPEGRLWRKCGNPSCVKPEHMQYPTEKEKERPMPVPLTPEQRQERFDRVMSQVQKLREKGQA